MLVKLDSRLAKHFKCPDDDNAKLVECLKKLSGEDLANAHRQVHFRWKIFTDNCRPKKARLFHK